MAAEATAAGLVWGVLVGWGVPIPVDPAYAAAPAWAKTDAMFLFGSHLLAFASAFATLLVHRGYDLGWEVTRPRHVLGVFLAVAAFGVVLDGLPGPCLLALWGGGAGDPVDAALWAAVAASIVLCTLGLGRLLRAARVWEPIAYPLISVGWLLLVGALVGLAGGPYVWPR